MIVALTAACDSNSTSSAEAGPGSLTGISNSTYAEAGYELGVGSESGKALSVCSYEVASWIQSITSDGITVSVSARGPVELSFDVQTTERGHQIQRTHVGEHRSEATVEFTDVPAASVQTLTVSATDGGQGRGGSCLVAPAGGALTGDEYCAKKQWPQKLTEDLIGLDLNDAILSYRELGCFTLGEARSTEDGHDVGADPIGAPRRSEIVSVSPSPGFLVSPSTVVNLRVHPSN